MLDVSHTLSPDHALDLYHTHWLCWLWQLCWLQPGLLVSESSWMLVTLLSPGCTLDLGCWLHLQSWWHINFWLCLSTMNFGHALDLGYTVQDLHLLVINSCGLQLFMGSYTGHCQSWWSWLIMVVTVSNAGCWPHLESWSQVWCWWHLGSWLHLSCCSHLCCTSVTSTTSHLVKLLLPNTVQRGHSSWVKLSCLFQLHSTCSPSGQFWVYTWSIFPPTGILLDYLISLFSPFSHLWSS